MALTDASLEIEVEWEDAPDITTPELSATWARLSIVVGCDPISLVERQRSSTSTAIYVAAYPLAEWIAYNWWLLDSDYRPARLLPDTRHRRLRSPVGSWQTHHRLISVGDGMPWPDLVLVPVDDESLEATWRPRDCGTIRFLNAGRAVLDKSQVQAALSGFVEDVLERLRASRIEPTPLQTEWESIRSLDQAEVDFCRASASLGLDPFTLSDDVSELVIATSKELSGALLDDFLVTTTLATLRDDLDWTNRALRDLRPEPTAHGPVLTAELNPGTPWTAGYEDARRLRTDLDLSATSAFDLDDVAVSRPLDGTSKDIKAIGVSTKDRVDLVAPTDLSRFSIARGVWRGWRSDRPFLISATGGMTVHKAERAFAAELLAPSEGIRQLLAEQELAEGWVGADRIDEIAAHFNVAPLVIDHQVRNHFGIEAEGGVHSS